MERSGRRNTGSATSHYQPSRQMVIFGDKRSCGKLVVQKVELRNTFPPLAWAGCRQSGAGAVVTGDGLDGELPMAMRTTDKPRDHVTATGASWPSRQNVTQRGGQGAEMLERGGGRGYGN